MSGAVAVALCLGAMVVLMLLGGADLQHDLESASWMRHAVLASGVGAGAGVVLGGIVGALLGRLGQGPMSASVAGGALALAAATGFYLWRTQAPVKPLVLAGVGAAAVGAALGIVVWTPFAIFHGVRARLRR